MSQRPIIIASGLRARRTPKQRFADIFEQSGGWASVPMTESWRKPDKFMGPIDYGRKRREPGEIVRITVRIEHETEKAWLLVSNGTEFWFPKGWGDLEIDDVTGWAALVADIDRLREKGVAPNDNNNRLHQDALRTYYGAGLRLLVS